MRKTLTLFLAVLLACTVTPGVAAAYQPPGGAVFNVPRPWGSDTERFRIVRTAEKAIRRAQGPTAARPKPIIQIATYLMDRRATVDALVGACRRGISVRVILDEDIVNRNSKRLIQVLNSDNVPDRDGDGEPDRRPRSGPCNRPLPGERQQAKTLSEGLISDKQARAMAAAPTDASVTWGADKSYVKRCDGSCRGAGGNMHSKFYTFTRTGKAENVVMVSSSNLNDGGALLGWNDMIVMKNRPRSLAKYSQIHRAMTEDDRAGDGKVEIVDGPYTSRFFPMRRAGKRNDPTLKDLNKIGCRGAWGRTQVHVSMFYWKGSRGDYLADKLLNLARNGCDVNIIYGAPSIDMAERLRDAARRNLIDLFDSRWDHNNDGYNEVRTHSKFVLVKGRYGTRANSRQVMTGTQNWVSGSLSRGDENSLNVSNVTSIYNDYKRNWERIRNHSRRLPYNR